jgi:uncharacterized protein YbjT (DUF2867 family)
MTQRQVRVLLFGASGMVGAGVLLECLEDPEVSHVLSVGRSELSVRHQKLEHVLHQDFTSFSGLRERFAACDACFFCLGISSVGLDEATYTRITVEYTLAAAQELARANPEATFCYVSGAGTDSTGKGGRMWARVKGRVENALLALPFRQAFMFRPGFIQPVRGVRSKTGWYQAVYSLTRPITPLVRRLFPGAVTDTATLGRAMIAVARDGYAARILDPADINRLGAS